MKDFRRGLTEDARKLDSYLQQYGILKKRRKALELRRKEIILNFQNPLKANIFNGMPKAKGKREDSCTILPLRLDEIDTRIKENMEDSLKEYQKVESLIDFLPKTSKERLVLEYRYLDHKRWEDICRIESMSKTPIIQLWRKGLYNLLEFAKIKKIVGDR